MSEQPLKRHALLSAFSEKFIRNGRVWVTVIVLMLVGNAMAMGTLALMAGPASERRVIPDYYNRAASYDITVAQHKQNQRLGWKLAATVTQQQLAVTLSDRWGAQTGCHVTATLQHRLRQDRDGSMQLIETGAPGRYLASSPLGFGIYDGTFTATCHGEQFVVELAIESAP